MDRKQFLSSLGLGLTAVCAGGCLVSCSKEGGAGGNGMPAPVLPPNGITVDLSTEIRNAGESLVRGGVIIVRLAQGSDVSAFTAVQVACTHQGTPVNFIPSDGRFRCPNHGSQFSVSGQVLNGPAASDLPRYRISISGNTMTVTS